MDAFCVSGVRKDYHWQNVPEVASTTLKSDGFFLACKNISIQSFRVSPRDF